MKQQSNRNRLWVYGCLLVAWTLVFGWQVGEHVHVQEMARAALIERAKDISTTVGIVLRAQRRFGGVISRERVESALADLIKPGDLNGLALLNATGSVVVSSGSLTNFAGSFGSTPSVRWGSSSVVVMNLVDLGTNVTQDIESSAPPIVLSREERFRSGETNRMGRHPMPMPFHAPPEHGAGPWLDALHEPGNRMPPPFSRPPWMSPEAYKAILQKEGVHSFVVVMSTRDTRSASRIDLRLRIFIVFLATIAVIGIGLSWRSLCRSAELQLRLVRASELTAHAKEMNLAAAGLAHETRNPLNIIRGLAQMITKGADLSPEIRERSRAIVDEADKVAAQLNEFINYSRPREVNRTPVALLETVKGVVQALGYDVEEKRVLMKIQGDPIVVEADEQLLRQTLFNLLINAVQAVAVGGSVDVVIGKIGATQGFVEIRDDGPGVPDEHRADVFKPYFTTRSGGVGLGLAVVQQIVLAHGWDIVCLPNEPQGAIFRISHMALMGRR